MNRHISRVAAVAIIPALLAAVALASSQSAGADVPPGTRQDHGPGGSRIAFTWNIWGVCGSPEDPCGDQPVTGPNSASTLEYYLNLEYMWDVGAPYAAAAAQEICSKQAYWISVRMIAEGIGPYIGYFRPVMAVDSPQCEQFGTAVWGLGSFVSQPLPLQFSTGVQTGRSRGMGCVNVNFFGSYFACSFHLHPTNQSHAATQLAEVAAYATGLGTHQIVAGDANLTPGADPLGSPAMNQMISAGYSEADRHSSCLPLASCSSQRTFPTRDCTSCETKKIDYIFAKGFALSPRAHIWATPGYSDHSVYFGYRP